MKIQQGRMYIYEQIGGRAYFQEAIKMIGFGYPERISASIPGCFNAISNFVKTPEGERIYEVWFPDYLEAHPDSTSDFMLEAGIIHQSVSK